MTIYPIILSGGAGSRLWPLSREHYPKPLLRFAGEQTLLEDTTTRLDGLADLGAPLFVCNEEHRFLVAEQVHKLGKVPETILLEPEGRNTAPALTLAALRLAASDPASLMVVMPADHVIPDRAAFQEAIRAGRALAEQGHLVTFGVVPSHAETGYGYIRKGAVLDGGPACGVAEFVEKPDATTVQRYLDSGQYLWNAGIFVMRADRWLDEIARHRPDIAEVCRAAYGAGREDADFYRVDRALFLSSPSDSIDYAVMEHTDRAAVVPLDVGWSDVGSWSSLWNLCPRDADGNVIFGDVIALDTHNALLVAESRCVATVGIEDLIVVETADAVLVASKAKAQEVKEIVSWLKRNKRDEYRFHRKVYRPWGTYEGVDAGPRFQVKRLTVNPGAVLSRQMHHHRAEHWVVVKGTAKVTRGDEELLLTENQSTYIPLGTTHRLANPGTIPLEIIEVQSGSYLGEDDIVRFEDAYDRCSR
jgi:mannose-1-phosphate guanylyltransferase/mannose-6-phosphate isomerase